MYVHLDPNVKRIAKCTKSNNRPKRFYWKYPSLLEMDRATGDGGSRKKCVEE